MAMAVTLVWHNATRHAKIVRCVSSALTNGLCRSIHSVKQLNSWDTDNFRQQAFLPAVPAKLPCDAGRLPPACTKWFIQETQTDRNDAKLRLSFWDDHRDIVVPLELTTNFSDGGDPSEMRFDQREGPLQWLLMYLRDSKVKSYETPSTTASIYLAQCDLHSLPQAMQDDLPTPEIVKAAGKGDIYSTSLWLGRPPTYTPLHRDPNPNLFWQLAGQKVLRLFEPAIGQAIFDHVQEQLESRVSNQASSAVFRGEEMMQGPERHLLHDAVWKHDSNQANRELLQHGQEVTLGMGEALFIPKSWWHSVKSIGHGVSCSANWWFR